MSSTFRTVHYIDFHGDLRTTACGLETSPTYADCSVFLSGATCPSCADAVQARIGDVPLEPPQRAHRRSTQAPAHS